MLDAHNPALRMLALQQLIDALQTGRWEELIKAGLKPETLERLRRTPLEDAAIAAARDELHVLFSIDGDSLEQILNRIERQRADEAIKEYFVRHCATPTLIKRLFKLDRSTVERLRHLLGANVRGRTPMPKPKERDVIHAKWRELGTDEPDLRMRYYRLHQAFPHHAIRVLEAVLKEFDD